jgi:SPP1 gp7 family putative phage head morphogenesis protein
VVRRERLFVAEYAAPTSFAPRASLEWLKQKQLYVSGVARDDLLKRAKALLLQALKTGEPEEETMRKLYESWVPYVGTDVDPNALARLRTIIRTNSTEALNEGIVAEARSPEMAKVIKALVYVATLDDRTTPLCEFLHGTQIWPDDPRLDAIVPPNHFNCRSILDPVIDDDEYDPDALLSIDKYREAVAMIEPGFGGGKAVNLKEAQ